MKAAWIFRRIRRTVQHRPLAVAALVAAFALLTAIAGASLLSSRIAGALGTVVADNVHVIAYLRDDMPAQRTEALVSLVREVPGVQAVSLVPSPQAFARLQEDVDQIGGAAELLAGMEEGFLPASVEITLAPSVALSERAQRLSASLRRFDGVVEVDAMEDGLSAVRALMGALHWLGWGLFALALLASVAVLALPLLRERQQRTQEAALLLMLGATPRAIRLPWSLLGAGSALLGGVLGVALLYLVFGVVVGAMGESLGQWPVGANRFLAPVEAVLVVAVAVVLGFGLGRRAVHWPGARPA